MKISKPMLASKLEDLTLIKYPVLCTPKLDGIRCLKIDGKAVSRTFKPIANHYCRQMVEKYFPDGVDGELMVEGNFQAVSSAVMTEDGEPNITYYIFDYVTTSLNEPYKDRVQKLNLLLAQLLCKEVPKKLFYMVLPITIKNEKELLEFEKDCLEKGFEGVILRDPNGSYKCGRSTPKEGYLLKLKRFEDVEAVIIDTEERFHNANEAEKDAFGKTKRSTHQANQIPTDSLGALVVKSKEFKSQYKVGSGFTEEQRKYFWLRRREMVGKIIKVKYQPVGVMDVPRFPTFIGFRDKRDI